jgi:hypothetical protein
MMMIEKVIGREFLKNHKITDLKPQNPTAPTISMDVLPLLWLLAPPTPAQLLLLRVPLLLPPPPVVS